MARKGDDTEDDAAAHDCILDIRTVDAHVTEVFLGPDWSRAHWLPATAIVPETRRAELLAAFEARMAAKQRLVSRISPAKTPSRLLSSLQLGTPTGAPPSARKRGHGPAGSPLSARAASDSERDCENIRPSPSRLNLPLETPLKRSKVLPTPSPASSPSPASRAASPALLAVHSDDDAPVADYVQLDEEFEPQPQQQPLLQSQPQSQLQSQPQDQPAPRSRCIIM